MEELSGRVALVTGASGGIGAAVAKSLADRGVRVGIASRSGHDLGIEGTIAAPCDVRDPAAVDAFVAKVLERFGGLDILVANAGSGAYGPFLELDPAHLEEMIDTNVKGTIYALRACLPHLVKSDRADFVTVALGGRSSWTPVRGRVLRVQVRAGGIHPRDGSRAASAGRSMHEHLPRRRRDGVRDGSRPDGRHARARRHDGRRGRRGRRDVRDHQAAEPPHPRDGVQADDGGVVGVTGGTSAPIVDAEGP